MIDRALDRHLPSPDDRPAELHEAMRYGVTVGGKRIRPILCLAAVECVGGDVDDALLPALALEVLHTYSLVHDDLPCMDDDALRRGHPTVHVQFGESTAVLTGDALLTLAFEWIARASAPDPYLPTQLVLELAEAAGSHGVIGGQVEDLAAEGKTATERDVQFIHLHKTAALIRAAVRIGAIVGGAAPEELDALTMYGGDIGLAFQIADDILNQVSREETLGKPVGSDAARKKSTFVELYGLDQSKERAEDLITNAITQLGSLHGDTEPLAAIARFVIERTH